MASVSIIDDSRISVIQISKKLKKVNLKIVNINKKIIENNIYKFLNEKEFDAIHFYENEYFVKLGGGAFQRFWDTCMYTKLRNFD